MKSLTRLLIVGDYHEMPVGETLMHLVHREKPTHLVSLGDYDIIASIAEFIEVAQYCREKGIDVLDVPGNHDHAIFNNEVIQSGHLRTLKTTVKKLHAELNENPAAMEYLKSLLSPKNAVRRIKIGNVNAAIVHGAYTGDTHESDYQVRGDWVDNLWFRLLGYPNFRLNFDQMSLLGEQLMIRGHDHLPAFARDCKGVVGHDKFVSGVHNLDEHCQHVIAPGAFCDGYYALLEEAHGKLKARFEKL